MARYVSLSFRAGCACMMAGGLVWMAMISSPLQAQQPMMAPTTAPAPATAPAASTAQAKAVPAKAPVTNAAPVVPPDTMWKYGKILSPSDQMSYPLKLRMPFPGVGEVKVPTADELVMREKLEQLAKLSDADIRTQLAQWPAFNKMSLRDEGGMLARIQDFRDYRGNTAKMKAHDMGLLTLLPDQQAKFEKEYWDKRLQMDRDLAKQFGPVMQAAQQKMLDDLYREFSAASQVPVAQGGKPATPGTPVSTNATKAPVAPAPPATATQKPATTNAPVAQTKPAASTTNAPTLGAAPTTPPMAQSPK